MWFFAPLALTLASLPPVSGAPVGCTATWTGAGGDASWSAPANWSSGRRPGGSDRACIPAGASVEVRRGAAVVGSVDVRGTLQIRRSSMRLTDWGALSSIARLRLTSGGLAGAGTVRVTRSLRWDGGVMTGDRTVLLAAGARGLVSGGWLDRATLRNDAVLIFDRARLAGSNGAVLDNRSDAVLTRTRFVSAGGATPA